MKGGQTLLLTSKNQVYRVFVLFVYFIFFWFATRTGCVGEGTRVCERMEQGAREGTQVHVLGSREAEDAGTWRFLPAPLSG